MWKSGKRVFGVESVEFFSLLSEPGQTSKNDRIIGLSNQEINGMNAI